MGAVNAGASAPEQHMDAVYSILTPYYVSRSASRRYLGARLTCSRTSSGSGSMRSAKRGRRRDPRYVPWGDRLDQGQRAGLSAGCGAHLGRSGSIGRSP